MSIRSLLAQSAYAAMIAALLFSATLASAAEPARPADAFVDSIGVNTHWSYPNVYSRRFAELKQKLAQSGIRHYRDGANLAVYTKGQELFQAAGLRATLICGRRQPGRTWKMPLDPSQIDKELAEIKTKALPFLDALEGPNEYDLSHADSEKTTWAESLLAYFKPLHEKTKADPQLRAVPIVAPSLTSEAAFKKVGDLSAWCDFSCAHPYLSARNPGTRGWGGNGYGSIDWILRLTTLQALGKPVQFTECGYQNALQVKSGHEPCSEATEAKYLPRMFAEYFRRGNIARAFKYELIDSHEDQNSIESHFGLLRRDLTEKPAFTAVKNLIAVLKDPGPSFTPDSLDFKLEGDTKNIRTLLLQKHNHDFYLLLWNEVPSWDVRQRKEIVNAPVAITLRLTAPPAAAQACTPSDGTEWKPLDVHGNTLNLSIPDQLLIIRLTPGK